MRDLSADAAPAGLLFAYHSTLKKKSEAARLDEALEFTGFQAGPGQATSPIQIICVADRGSWILTSRGGQAGWYFVSTQSENHLLAFASLISNTLYKSSGRKQGIGDYLLDPEWLQGPDPPCPRIAQ